MEIKVKYQYCFVEESALSGAMNYLSKNQFTCDVLKNCWMRGKQCRPWSYTIFWDVWFRSTLLGKARLPLYLRYIGYSGVYDSVSGHRRHEWTEQMPCNRVFPPTRILAVFTHKTLFWTLKILTQGSWVMHIWSIPINFIDLCICNVFISIYGTKRKNYQYFGKSLLLKH